MSVFSLIAGMLTSKNFDVAFDCSDRAFAIILRKMDLLAEKIGEEQPNNVKITRYRHKTPLLATLWSQGSTLRARYASAHSYTQRSSATLSKIRAIGWSECC